jgi:hypothetical protein
LKPDKVVSTRRDRDSKQVTHLIVQFEGVWDHLEVNYERMAKAFPAFVAEFDQDHEDDSD